MADSTAAAAAFERATPLERARDELAEAIRLSSSGVPGASTGQYVRAAQIGLVAQAEADDRIATALERLADAAEKIERHLDAVLYPGALGVKVVQ